MMFIAMPILYFAFVQDSYYWRTLGDRMLAAEETDIEDNELNFEIENSRNVYEPLLKRKI